MLVKAEFSFFKAGQGAFYGGSIRDDNSPKKWSVVYDCGTSNFITGNAQALNSEIDYFKRETNEIDILFISHLDYDHVSGVKRLLTEFTIHNIVIPYFPEEYRGFSLASFGDTDDPNNLSQQDYVSFLANPYLFLIQEGGEKLNLFVIKADNQKGNEGIEYGNYNPDNINDLHPVGDEIQDLDNIIEFKGLSNIRYFRNNFQFFGGNIWEFTTYVKPITSTQFSQLKAGLNTLLGRNPSDDISYTEIITIVTTEKAESHKLYKKHLNDINAHGLVLFHGPRNFNNLDIYHEWTDELNGHLHRHYNRNFRRRFLHHFASLYYKNNFTAELLTGDISLVGPHAISFPPSLQNKLKRVHLFQVPHHGSDKNWGLNEYENLGLGSDYRGFIYEPINVCNFGYGNKYGHPGAQMLKDLQGNLILNSQHLRFTTRYRLLIRR